MSVFEFDKLQEVLNYATKNKNPSKILQYKMV